MLKYLELSILGFLAALTPGPDSLFVLKNGLRGNFKNALFAALGILVGNLVYLSLVYFGLTSLAKNPYFLALVSFFGGVYLLYLAILSLREKGKIKVEFENKESINYKNTFIKALLINLSNPKAILFFSSILVPFLKKNIKVSLLFLYIGISFAFFTVALLSTKIKSFIEKEIFFQIINKVVGILFLIFSYKLFLQTYEAIKQILS
ncbi:MAG TPA: LysE family translocator [Aquificae bacterium]|nr:LysE family translocator [Aquificota bacterium]